MPYTIFGVNAYHFHDFKMFKCHFKFKEVIEMSFTIVSAIGKNIDDEFH